jgi:hypothetical protein
MSNSFEDLAVWKKSCNLAIKLLGLLIECKDFSLKDHMQRSICYTGMIMKLRLSIDSQLI